MKFKIAMTTWALALTSAGAFAQDVSQDKPPSTVPSPGAPLVAATKPGLLLTLDQERLFSQSAWGRAALADAETAATELVNESRQIDADLEQKERDLTDKRATMSVADFTPLANEFNQFVETQRAAQEVKSRQLVVKLDERRQRFFYEVRPILGELMLREGAIAILSKDAVFMARYDADITDKAIAFIDQRLPAPEKDTAAPDDQSGPPQQP